MPAVLQRQQANAGQKRFVLHLDPSWVARAMPENRTGPAHAPVEPQLRWDCDGKITPRGDTDVAP